MLRELKVPNHTFSLSTQASRSAKRFAKACREHELVTVEEWVPLKGSMRATIRDTIRVLYCLFLSREWGNGFLGSWDYY